MIKTKSIYEPKEKDDGYRILITRYYPRGIKKTHFDEWKRELSPSPNLLKSYKEGKIDWKRYERDFVNEMKSHSKMLQSLTSTNQNITLLCYEKDDTHCHRYIIKNMIDMQTT